MLTELDMAVFALINMILLTVYFFIGGYLADKRINEMDKKFSRKLQTFQARLTKGVKVKVGEKGEGNIWDTIVNKGTELVMSNPKIQKWTDGIIDTVVGDEEEELVEIEEEI